MNSPAHLLSWSIIKVLTTLTFLISVIVVSVTNLTTDFTFRFWVHFYVLLIIWLQKDKTFETYESTKFELYYKLYGQCCLDKFTMVNDSIQAEDDFVSTIVLIIVVRRFVLCTATLKTFDTKNAHSNTSKITIQHSKL